MSSEGLPTAVVSQQTSLLLVEDDDKAAELVLGRLRATGLRDAEVVRVTRLEAAMTCLSDRSVDVVLLDLSLPDSAGLTTVSRFRDAQREVPILVLSDLDNEAYGEQAIELGAQEFLSKRDATGREYARAIRRAVERRRLQAEVEQLRHELVQARKIEAIGRVAEGIAHDFNNLLTSIIGYADMALSQIDESKPLHNDLRCIYEAGLRAKALSRQLLAFGRKQELKIESVNLASAIAELEELIRPLIGEEISIETRVAPGVPRVRADRSQIQQMLMNLAINARDAMESGGRLEITLDRVQVEPDQVREGSMKPGGYARLTVADNGVGMSEEVQRRVFEPFFTTKGVGKGTGLGLAGARGTVRQLGGYLWLQSTVGVGTRFAIYLPETDIEAAAVKTAPRPPTVPGTDTILVVEDDPSVRKFAAAVLTRFGYRVVAAGTPSEALERVPGTGIDLLVTDVVLPERSGPELAEALVQRHPEMQVVFMSGYTDERVAKSLAAPSVAWLHKPFTSSGLLTAAREALDHGAGAGRRLA